MYFSATLVLSVARRSDDLCNLCSMCSCMGYGKSGGVIRHGHSHQPPVKHDFIATIDSKRSLCLVVLFVCLLISFDGSFDAITLSAS